MPVYGPAYTDACTYTYMHLHTCKHTHGSCEAVLECMEPLPCLLRALESSFPSLLQDTKSLHSLRSQSNAYSGQACPYSDGFCKTHHSEEKFNAKKDIILEFQGLR